MKTTYPRETKATRRARFYDRMRDMGFTHGETETLRRAQLTLHRWAEAECGDSNDHYSRCLVRDEETGKPFWEVQWHDSNKTRRTPTADREKGALRRIAETVKRRNERTPSNSKDPLVSYHQTDPRGCALYLVPVSELRDQDIASVYNRGFAVCVD